ncbi:hypothetical protein ACWIWK_04985 [Helicobacter sp. 23-1048]
MQYLDSHKNDEKINKAHFQHIIQTLHKTLKLQSTIAKIPLE